MPRPTRSARARAGVLMLAVLVSSPAALAAPRKPPARAPASGHPGCFLLMDLKTGEVTGNGAALCTQPLPPASTFKVPHALIALETGVVKADEVRKWDGVKRSVAMWNQDQTLDTAIRRSALWFFQDVAKQVGREREESWMKRLGYGNADASGDITLFWLGGPLRITPEAQLAFLARLYRDELPVSAANAETVKRALKQGPDTVASIRDGINLGGPWKDGAVLSAKTGTLPRTEGSVTWLVGHVAAPSGAYVFVSAVQSPPGPTPVPQPAMASAIEALKARGLL